MNIIERAKKIGLKGSANEKVLFLEGVVRTETVACLNSVLNYLGDVELTARALSIAGRYRGVEHVDTLLKHGATHMFYTTPSIKAKYNAYVGSGSSVVKTEYITMIVLPPQPEDSK